MSSINDRYFVQTYNFGTKFELVNRMGSDESFAVQSDNGSFITEKEDNSEHCFSYLKTIFLALTPSVQKKWVGEYEKIDISRLTYYEIIRLIHDLSLEELSRLPIYTDKKRVEAIVTRATQSLPRELHDEITTNNIPEQASKRSSRTRRLLDSFPSYGLEQLSKEVGSLASINLLLLKKALLLRATEHDKITAQKVVAWFQSHIPYEHQVKIYWVIGNENATEGKRLFMKDPWSKEIEDKLATGSLQMILFPKHYFVSSSDHEEWIISCEGRRAVVEGNYPCMLLINELLEGLYDRQPGIDSARVNNCIQSLYYTLSRKLQTSLGPLPLNKQKFNTLLIHFPGEQLKKLGTILKKEPSLQRRMHIFGSNVLHVQSTPEQKLKADDYLFVFNDAFTFWERLKIMKLFALEKKQDLSEVQDTFKKTPQVSFFVEAFTKIRSNI